MTVFFQQDPINNIDSDKGLTPTRQQALMWTNDGWITYDYMHHSASMIDHLVGLTHFIYCTKYRGYFC